MRLIDFTPIHDRVLVHVEKPEEISLGGIFLLEEDRAKIVLGTVIKTGPGRPFKERDVKRKEKGTYLPTRQYMPMHVQGGDKVLLGQFSGYGDKLTFDDENYRLVFETAILAVIDEAYIKNF